MEDRPAGDTKVPETPEASEGGLGLGVALLGFVVLALSVTQIRIFAYSLHPSLVNTVIAVTMLGLGVAATVLSLSARLRALPAGMLAGAACLGLAAAGLLANVVFARTSPLIHFGPTLTQTFTWATLTVVLLCTLPYALGGLALAAVLSRRTARIHRLYALNLLGSGLGCFAVNLLLRPLGAERLLLVLLALAALAGALLCRAEARLVAIGAVAVAAVLLAALPLARRAFPFKPDADDAAARTTAAFGARGLGRPVMKFEAWDPVAKVEIRWWPALEARTPDPVPTMFLCQDGGAGSVLLGMGARPPRRMALFESTLYGAGCGLRPGADVLVIGVGGTPDVQAALWLGARHVTAVEINQATIDATSGPLAAFLGDPLGRPEVRPVVQDGRSWVHATSERYDVIQMSGVDTLTVQSSGSFVMAEEYLYTVEAFVDYLRALKDDGILAMVRFEHEPIRLSAIAHHALGRLGVADTERHVVVLAQTRANLTMVKRTPWEPAELDWIERFVAESGERNAGLSVPQYALWGMHADTRVWRLYLPGRAGNHPVYDRLFEALRTGRDTSSLAVPTDDRPYYFAGDVRNWFLGGPVRPFAQAQMAFYVRFTGLLLGLAALLIVLPLAVFRLRGLRMPGAPTTLVYFFALGFSFMFLEIGLLQKSALIVEHPAYSVSVVLASLLVASAAGSHFAGRLRRPPRWIVVGAATVIAAIGVVYALKLDRIFDALFALPFAARMVAVALLIAPLGVAMGTLFPTGLRRLQAQPGGERLVPWAIGVNGFASVLGSVLSLPFAVVFGFGRLLLFGCLCYLVGCLAFVARRDQCGSR